MPAITNSWFVAANGGYFVAVGLGHLVGFVGARDALRRGCGGVEGAAVAAPATWGPDGGTSLRKRVGLPAVTRGPAQTANPAHVEWRAASALRQNPNPEQRAEAADVGLLAAHAL